MVYTSRHLSPRGEKELKGSEALRLVAYYDNANRPNPTIGWGHTRTVMDADVGVKQITEAEAQRLFESDIAPVIKSVNKIGASLPFQLSQNQFDALSAFTFNCGVDAFEGSTLVKLLRAGNVQGAADQMLRWNKSGGMVNKGLVNRRKRERAWFLEPDKITAAVVPAAGGRMGIASILGGFASKKFLVTSITAAVITFGGKLGINLDADMLTALVAVVVPYLLGQTVLDWSKIKQAAVSGITAAATALASPDNPDLYPAAVKPLELKAAEEQVEQRPQVEFGAEAIGLIATEVTSALTSALSKAFGTTSNSVVSNTETK